MPPAFVTAKTLEVQRPTGALVLMLAETDERDFRVVISAIQLPRTVTHQFTGTEATIEGTTCSSGEITVHTAAIEPRLRLAWQFVVRYHAQGHFDTLIAGVGDGVTRYNDR